MFGVSNKILFEELKKAKKVKLFNPSVDIFISISKTQMKKIAMEQPVDTWNITKFPKGILAISKD